MQRDDWYRKELVGKGMSLLIGKLVNRAKLVGMGGVLFCGSAGIV